MRKQRVLQQETRAVLHSRHNYCHVILSSSLWFRTGYAAALGQVRLQRKPGRSPDGVLHLESVGCTLGADCDDQSQTSGQP